MSPSFLAGCFLMLPLPVMVRRLRASAQFDRTHHATVVAAGPTGSGPVATQLRPQATAPVVPVDAEDPPPDRQPDVTPPVVKAGPVRRVVGTPCHSCRCCRIYGDRLHAEQAEVSRLRDELVRSDGRRINHSPPARERLAALHIPYQGVGGEA